MAADSSSNRITALLQRWREGEASARDALMAEAYPELRRLARSYLKHERPGHTLQATALLNEACLRLIPHGPLLSESREAFFRLMASEMRHRLIDHARRRIAAKRGGRHANSPLDEDVDAPAPPSGEDSQLMLDKLDEAVERLAREHPRAAQVVQLRYLLGLTTEETARQLGLSTGTVKRDWVFAKAWLSAALHEVAG
jgi:RNA polymerase sigma-70 factor, ECF subfamily